MLQLILGFVVLAGALWLARLLATANPQRLASSVKTAGAILALTGAAFLGARGQFGIAAPLGMAGLALLGWLPGMPAGRGQRWNKTPGQVSRVRTAFIEMELQHDSGLMNGRFLAGPRAGEALDSLDVPSLMATLAALDEESRSLLAAYLDRRDAGWREHAEAHATAGNGAATGGGPMSQEEAYQILGLEPGASAAEIGRAHRALMKKLHPDQGGSTYLAARVNQAKDVLLRRHH